MKEREPHLIIIDDRSEAQEWDGSRAEEAWRTWRAWAFTDKPPDNPLSYRLWRHLRMILKEEAL